MGATCQGWAGRKCPLHGPASSGPEKFLLGVLLDPDGSDANDKIWECCPQMSSLGLSGEAHLRFGIGGDPGAARAGRCPPELVSGHIKWAW